MPVEETGNLMLMLLGISSMTDNSVDWIPERYWPLIDGWAEYLWQTAYDPGNQVAGFVLALTLRQSRPSGSLTDYVSMRCYHQLCTDDFEGPSPHNANLAAKGILGMAAYAELVG